MKSRFVLAFAALLLSASFSGATEAAWSRLRDGGYTILIAGAQTAGGGNALSTDPAGCAGKRHLSDRGRQQAQRMGARFAARAVEISRVVASEQCSALETAQFVFSRNQAETFTMPEDEEPARQAIFDEITAFDRSGNQAFILDKGFIQAITGITPRESEAVIVEPNQDTAKLMVVGRIISD